MSLKTLLDAAEFLEQQEQQSHQPVLKPSPKLKTLAIAPAIMSHHNNNNRQKPLPATVLFTTTSDLAPGLLSLAQQSLKAPAPRRILHNSFDIIDPLANKAPLAFRAGTREVHNKLEKHRRAQLKECFDVLKKQLPAAVDEKKTSNLNILHSALRHIQALKRKERELEHEMERLARDKIAAQNRLAILKKDITLHYDNVDFAKILPDVVVPAAVSVEMVEASTSSVKEEVFDEVELLESVAAAAQSGLTERVVPVMAGKGTHLQIATTQALKHGNGKPVQTTALSVVPMSYSVPQGLVLQKLAIVPTKGLGDLTPLTHFITQQNGKVVPLMNAQYVVKPAVVVVSRPS